MTIWSTEVTEDVVDVRVAKSADQGRSWGAPTILSSDIGPYARYSTPVVASDRSGRWVAAWQAGSEVVTAHSDDFGNNWSSPQSVFNTVFRGYVDSPDLELATDESGNWLLVIGSESGMTRVISSDNGTTWSAGLRIAEPTPETPSVYVYVYEVGVAISEERWVVLWTEREYPAGGRVYSAFSTDAGASWSEAALMASGSEFFWISVSAGPTGHLIAMWYRSGNHTALEMSDSFDGGNSWSPVREASFFLLQATIRSGGPGVWYVVGSDYPNLLQARSIDDGQTWSEVHAASRDSFAQGSRINGLDLESDGTEAWQLVWLDSKLFGADSEHTGHWYPSLVSASSIAVCPPTPEPDCEETVRSGASKLSLRNDAQNFRGDSISWSWRGLTSAGASAVGDVLQDERFALCLYDSLDGVYRRIDELALTPQVDCTISRCWEARGNGWSFHDPFGLSGELRSAKVKVSPFADRMTKLVLSASGPALTPPPIPPLREPEVVAQFHSIVAGNCWTAHYSAPSEDSAQLFKARSD